MAAISPSAAPGHEERVRDPLMVACLLRRAAAARELATVELPGHQVGMSLILGVDLAAGRFEIDQIFPSEADEAARHARRIRMRVRIEGAEAELETEPLERLEDGQGTRHRLALPEALLYRQRRGHHRVPVPRNLAVAVRYALPDGSDSEARLTDASVGGIGLETSGGAAAALRPGDTLPRCAILLPDRTTVAGPLEICYVDERLPNRTIRLGGRFASLEPRDRRRLERFVAALERDYIRRLPGRR